MKIHYGGERMVKVKLLSTKGNTKEFENIIENFVKDKKEYKISHDMTMDPEDLSTTFTALVVYEE